MGFGAHGARTSTLDTSEFQHLGFGARRSVHAPRRSTLRRIDARRLNAWCTHLNTRRSVHAPRRSTLRRSSTPRRSVHAPRRSTLGARTSTLDAQRCTHLDARRVDASTLGASTPRRLVHTPRRSTLRRIDARRLNARCTHLDARRSVHAPRCSMLRRFDARCTHLDARRFGARRSVHAPRRSTLGARTSTLDARCTHLDARALDARHARTSGARRLVPNAQCLTHALRCSTLRRLTHSLRCSTLRRSTHAHRCSSFRYCSSVLASARHGFHRCVTCQAKLPASDPHEDCVACLGPDHAASALADRAYCHLCAGFQTRTLRQRARKAVGGRSPSSGSSHTISAPPLSVLTPLVTSQPPRSPISQLTAGQRSPARRARERSRSPSSRGARPRRESRSRSRSPRCRRYSRSPRRGRRHQDTFGVAELTSKMSQFMEVMMGQQSLLMTLANVVPRVPELPTGPITGQPVVPPPVPHGQPQEVWDVDAVSRDASDAEPLFEEGTEPEVASQH
ncbi:UNVERIFIED_CONTAM: hypothetical protein FKN15_012470 [Acipenser sinensis]